MKLHYLSKWACPAARASIIAGYALGCSAHPLASSGTAPQAPTVQSTRATNIAAANQPCRPPGPPPNLSGGRAGRPFTRTTLKLIDEFDQDGDHRLNRRERDAARAHMAEQRKAGAAQGRGPMGPPPGMPSGGARGTPFGPFADRPTPAPGPSIALADIPQLPSQVPLYAPATLRTLWFEFGSEDWEDELAAFYDTDVEVPAKLIVDGATYEDVGVGFRGMSSYSMVPAGFKRSLNVSTDTFREGQRLLGYTSLNLLNSAHDPTYLRAILALEIARHYLPTPSANHVRVVINGKNWGVYVNVQQYNGDFLQQWYGARSGRRWKVPGSPAGRGSLEYLGEDPQPYSEIYHLKGPDSKEAYGALIRLCRVLGQTAPEQLEQELGPLLDIEGALKFLALENLFINNDGYFLRTSDYNLYENTDGRFSLVLHDVNETFNALEPGPGSSSSKGVELDPLEGADDPKRPLISKLLAVPRLRQRYLDLLHEMAQVWLDWDRLGPIVDAHRAAIQAEVKRDPRKLDSYDEFLRGFTQNSVTKGPCHEWESFGIKPFVQARRAFLLGHPSLRSAP